MIMLVFHLWEVSSKASATNFHKQPVFQDFRFRSPAPLADRGVLEVVSTLLFRPNYTMSLDDAKLWVWGVNRQG